MDSHDSVSESAPPVQDTAPRVALRRTATRVLIAINVVVWGVQVARGMSPLAPTVADLIPWGTNTAVGLVSGQWWRLLTAMFLHYGAVHLFMNMSALHSVGGVVEHLVGWRRMLSVYFFAGIAGGLLKLAVNPLAASAGASGAIFGLDGALLAFYILGRATMPAPQKKEFHQSFRSLLIWTVIIAVGIPNIDQASHLGGFLGGLGAAFYLLRFVPNVPRRLAMAAVTLALVLVPCGVVSWGIAQRNPWVGAIQAQERGLERVRRQDMENALLDFQHATELVPTYGFAYVMQGAVHGHFHRYRAQVDALNLAEANGAEKRLIANSRAWALLQLGEARRAAPDAEEAVRLQPDDGNVLDTRAWVRLANGDSAGARQDAAHAVELRLGQPAAALDVGLVAFIDGRYADAEREWTDAVASVPTLHNDLDPWIAKAQQAAQRTEPAP